MNPMNPTPFVSNPTDKVLSGETNFGRLLVPERVDKALGPRWQGSESLAP